MCRSMVDIQSAAAEIRRGKKRKRRTNHSMKIYMVSLLHRATIKKLIWSESSKTQHCLLSVSTADV